MSTTKPTLTELLRAGLLAQLNVVSMREISRQTGVPESILSRFIRGRQSLRLPFAEALAGYLRITFTMRGPNKARRGLKSKGRE